MSATRGDEAPVARRLLDRHRKLELDTSVFIYAVEENPNYLELVRPILKWVEGAKGKRWRMT